MYRSICAVTLFQVSLAVWRGRHQQHGQRRGSAGGNCALGRFRSPASQVYVLRPTEQLWTSFDGDCLVMKVSVPLVFSHVTITFQRWGRLEFCVGGDQLFHWLGSRNETQTPHSGSGGWRKSGIRALFLGVPFPTKRWPITICSQQNLEQNYRNFQIRMTTVPATEPVNKSGNNIGVSTPLRNISSYGKFTLDYEIASEWSCQRDPRFLQVTSLST